MCFQPEPPRGGVRELFLKRWKKHTEPRRPLEGPYLDFLRKYTEPWTDNPIELFMQDYVEPMLREDIREVLELCKQMLVLELNETTKGLRAAAWLDDSCAQPGDRSPSLQGLQESGEKAQPTPINQPHPLEQSPPRIFRRYEGYLTAHTLLQNLLEKRFDHESLPDADRRLIHITDLDPPYILALALSAPKHQVPALRSAICKHVTFQTSLKITPGSYGYSVFQLELHFSFFALRRDFEPDYASSGKVQPRRKWTDLSFITGFPSGIHEVQTSFHVCGSDDTRWIGYSMVDTHFDEDGEMREDAFSYEDFMADQPTNTNDGMYDANMPIWDVREYFLKVFRVRVGLVVKEWGILIRAVESGIKKFTDTQSARSCSPERDRNEDIKEALKWRNKTLSILTKFKESLRITNNAWTRFSAHDGDIDYFSNMDLASPTAREHTERSLLEIKGLFEELKEFEVLLEILVGRCHECERSANDFNLQLQELQSQLIQQLMQQNKQLMLENNQTVQRNGTAAEFNILAVSPLTVASALFNIPDDVLPFERNSVSFFIFTVVITFVYWVLLMLARIWQTWPARLWSRMKEPHFRTKGMSKSPKEFSGKNFLRQQNRQSDSVGSSDTDLMNTAVNVEPIAGFHAIERPTPNRSQTWAP